MKPGIAHIVYASDDGFTEMLGVSLVSLYENSKDMDDIVVYVLDGGIKDEHKQRIDYLPSNYGRSKIRWLPAQSISEGLSIKVKVDRGSLSQYARVFVSSALPEDLDRVLYLDCDIVFEKSVRELWNLNLQGKTIGALMDAFSAQYRANIGLRRDDIMFNSGVMLIDLVQWKEKRVERRLLKFIESKNGIIQQGDQGALNAVLSRDTFCFEPRFNSVTIFYDFSYEELLIYRKPTKGFYSEKEVQVAVNEPVIIHSTTSFLSKRPWFAGCQHRYVGEWLKYKRLSPWAETELWQDTTGKVKLLIVEMLKKMPRRLMIRICGLAQAYLRPWMNKICR